MWDRDVSIVQNSVCPELRTREDKEQTTECVHKVHVPAVRRPTLVRQEGNLG